MPHVSSTSSGLRVLLIEDAPGDASLATAALTSGATPVDVVWKQTLHDALDDLSRQPADCIVADLGLPDAIGLEVVTAVRAANGDTPLVVLTGNADDEAGTEAIRAGADDYVFKSDVTSGQLRRIVTYAVERLQVQRAIVRLNTRAEAVMANIDDGLLVLDRDGFVTAANPAAGRLLRDRTDQLVGAHVSSFYAIVHTADGSAITDSNAAAAAALRTGARAQLDEVAVTDPDGVIEWADIRAYPIFDASDQIDGVVISVRDVTARHNAEEATRFRAALLDATAQAVVVTDPAGQILVWNAGAEALYGWRSEEVLGQPILEVNRSRGLGPEMPVVTEQLRAGKPWTGEIDAFRKDDSLFPALVTCAPVFDGHEQLAAVITISTDISAQRAARETERTLSTIVTSTADAIFTKSLDGIVQSWNRGAERLYGYTADDIIGQHVSILAASEADVIPLTQAVAGGETISGLEVVRRRRDGSDVHVSLTITPMYDDATVIGASVIARDISDRKQLEAELRVRALYDPLTDLPNRTLLDDRLAQALHASGRRGQPVSVLFCDLDAFKRVNDIHGHLTGDLLLQQVAQRLVTTVRPSDTVARFGGDEFVIVCADTDTESAYAVADRIHAALREPVEVQGNGHHVTASIGIAVAPPLARDAVQLLSFADVAMYEAKTAGRGESRAYDASMLASSTERAELAADLRRALSQEQLAVHYQPQIEMETGIVVGVEALLRWECPKRGWVPPSLLISVAEEDGFAVELDDWVMRQAMSDTRDLLARRMLPAGARVAVNRVGRSVAQAGFADRVVALAAASRLPLEALEIEVTETALLHDLDTAGRTLARLRELGVTVALDDFGTGYSSLTYVRQLPVSRLKIDRSFVEHVVGSPDDLAICTSIVDLGRALGLDVLAEGVETPEQATVLRRLGCTSAQGYLWAPAQPLDRLVPLLAKGRGKFDMTVATVDVPTHRRTTALPVTNEHGLHRLFAMHRQGASLATMAAALNADGYLTPTGQRWHPRSVARALADVLSSAPPSSDVRTA